MPVLLGVLATRRARPARRRTLDLWADALAVMSHQSNSGTVGIPNIGNSPIGYIGARHICPQNYPFPLTDPQTPLPASSLARPTYHTKLHPDLFRRFPQCTGQTHGHTQRQPTDG